MDVYSWQVLQDAGEGRDISDTQGEVLPEQRRVTTEEGTSEGDGMQ